MERVCFLLKVKPEKLDEYKERHKAVWPEMLQALREAGWHNYSIFLREDACSWVISKRRLRAGARGDGQTRSERPLATRNGAVF